MRMDILQAISGGAEGPTQIMYRANLSWLLLRGNLKALTELGFVKREEVGRRKRYVLSERGLYVLRSYLDVVREVDVENIIPTPLKAGVQF